MTDTHATDAQRLREALEGLRAKFDERADKQEIDSLEGPPRISRAAGRASRIWRMAAAELSDILAIPAIARAVAAPVEGDAGNRVVAGIVAERRRQVEVEGWTPEHDDRHSNGEMARAAGCYALHAGQPEVARVPKPYAPADWPWDRLWWKPKDRRRDLIRAAALIVAEIERLDRARPAAPATTTEGGEDA